MELKEIEPKNLTDEIVESMCESEVDADVVAETELIVKPEPVRQTIRQRYDSESIYENPYSTNIYHDYGGAIAVFDSNDQPRNRNWSLSCLIIGIVIGLLIGGTVTGLSIQFTKTTLVYGESNYCLTRMDIFLIFKSYVTYDM